MLSPSLPGPSLGPWVGRDQVWYLLPVATLSRAEAGMAASGSGRGPKRDLAGPRCPHGWPCPQASCEMVQALCRRSVPSELESWGSCFLLMKSRSLGRGVRKATKNTPHHPTSGRGGQAGLRRSPFSPVLGKGPYQLARQAASGTLVSAKTTSGAIVLVSAEGVAPGAIVNFLLTAALHKAKAHGKAHPWPHSSTCGGRQVPEEGGSRGPQPSAMAGKVGGVNSCPFPSCDGVWGSAS